MPTRLMFGLPWPLFWAEGLGTFLLVAVGCSLVIFNFGLGSPVAHLLPDPLIRRMLTGFLFGSTGALIALSWVGRESGAHINPVVTLAFWLLGKLKGRYLPGYVLAQLLGAALGGLPLLLWGGMGRSIQYAVTLPGAAGPWVALLGETFCTFLLVAGLFFFVGQPRLRGYTPFAFSLSLCPDGGPRGTALGNQHQPGPQSGVSTGGWNLDRLLALLVGATAGNGIGLVAGFEPTAARGRRCQDLPLPPRPPRCISNETRRREDKNRKQNIK